MVDEEMKAESPPDDVPDPDAQPDVSKAKLEGKSLELMINSMMMDRMHGSLGAM